MSKDRNIRFKVYTQIGVSPKSFNGLKILRKIILSAKIQPFYAILLNLNHES